MTQDSFDPQPQSTPRAGASASPPPIPPRPVQALSYRTPQQMAVESSGPMWREGKLAVSYRDVPFPPRCVKCNAPLQADERKRSTMYWQHPGYFATLLLGVLIGAIILLCIRQKTEVTVGMCKAHRNKRRLKILYGWLIALAGLGCWVMSVFFMSPGPWKNYGLTPICFILGLVLIITSLIWALVATRAVSVQRIADQTVWFSGCGEAFLASLES